MRVICHDLWTQNSSMEFHVGAEDSSQGNRNRSMTKLCRILFLLFSPCSISFTQDASTPWRHTDNTGPRRRKTGQWSRPSSIRRIGGRSTDGFGCDSGIGCPACVWEALVLCTVQVRPCRHGSCRTHLPAHADGHEPHFKHGRARPVHGSLHLLHDLSATGEYACGQTIVDILASARLPCVGVG